MQAACVYEMCRAFLRLLSAPSEWGIAPRGLAKMVNDGSVKKVHSETQIKFNERKKKKKKRKKKNSVHLLVKFKKELTEINISQVSLVSYRP